MNKKFFLFLPFAAFLLMAALFFALLSKERTPSVVPSALVGKAMPAFALASGLEEVDGFSSAALPSSPFVVNFFASWCLSCQAEQKVFAAVAEDYPVFGIAYKDKPEDLEKWLAAHGNPFRAIGSDKGGGVAIDWGVTGVPETFIVDGKGIIRHKHTGPVMREIYDAVLKPLLRELEK